MSTTDKDAFKFTRKPYLEPFFLAFSTFPIVRGELVVPKKGISFFNYDHNFFQKQGMEYFKQRGLYPYAIDQIHSKLVFLVNENFAPYDGWGDSESAETKKERILLYLTHNFSFSFNNFWMSVPEPLKTWAKSDSDLEFKVVPQDLFNEVFEYILNPNLIDEYNRGKKIADARDRGFLYTEEGESQANDLLDSILTFAVINSGTDVHFENTGERCVARIRIDGDLRDYPNNIPEHLYAPLINVIRVRSEIDVAEHFKPQDGKMTFECSFVDTEKVSSTYDIRVSIIPEVDGHLNAVLRILAHGSFKKLNQLGFTDDVYKEFQILCKEPHGLILVTGPTGSGKTTTLYSALNELNTPDMKTLSAEEPVEIKMPGVTQVSINQKQGRTFPIIMRHFLRHDPDIILVGEIRDVETAKLAIEAANTGHLVFSTLHTNDAVSAIKRLGNMDGIDVGDFSFCLKGVLAQRLIKVFNPEIRKLVTAEMSEEKFTSFMRDNGLTKLDLGAELNTIWGEEVLERCHLYSLEAEETQYRGRTAITEFWKIGAKSQDYIFNNKFATKDLEELAINEDKMLPMCVTGMEKVLTLQTSFSELVKVVGIDSIRKYKKLLISKFFNE